MSSYKNSYVPWRGSASYSASNPSNSSLSTNSSSKYSSSASKPEVSNNKTSSYNTGSSAVSSSSGYSRFTASTTGTSSTSASNSGRGLNSSSLLSNSSSPSGTSGSKRENTFNSTSSTTFSSAFPRQDREKSGLGTGSSIRDKISSLSSSNSNTSSPSNILNPTNTTSSSTLISREKSGLGSTSTSSTSASLSKSVKREKSNVSSCSSSSSATAYAREKSGLSSSLNNTVHGNNLTSSSKLLTSVSKNDTSEAAASSTSSTCSSSLYHPSYLRSGLSSSVKQPTTNTSSSSTSKDFNNTTTGNYTNNNNSNNNNNNSTSGYRLFSSRNSTNSGQQNNDKSGGNTDTKTSSLKSTSRFLRSGHYSSVAANKILEESLNKAMMANCNIINKQEKNTDKNRQTNNEPKTWMSRGTCTESSVDDAVLIESDISLDTIPTVNPNHDVTIVVKHKEAQTDDKICTPIPSTTNKYVSSIPRPSPSYYSPYSRFSSSKSNNDPEAESNNSSLSTTTTTSIDSKSNSAHNNKTSNNKNTKLLSGGILSQQQGDQSHRSHISTASRTILEANDITNSGGVVVNLPNKEFRKSALNVGLGNKEAEEEFAKKQEELRLLKGQQQQQHTTSKTSDLSRRPPTPTDPKKSTTNSSNINSNHQSRSMNRLPGGALSKAKSAKNITPIRKNSTSSCSESECSSSTTSSSMSSTSITRNCTSSAIKTATSTSNLNNINDDRRKKGGVVNCNNNNNNLRRGSVTSTTSCSSAASSRSSSSDRSSRSSSKNSGISRRPINNNSQIPTGQTTKTMSESGNNLNSTTSSATNNDETGGEEEVSKQTSYLLRSLASNSEKLSWVRRCESGSQIPWWLAGSNSNVPDLGAKNNNNNNNNSASHLTKSPTSKQSIIPEEQDCSSPSLPTASNNTNSTQHRPKNLDFNSDSDTEQKDTHENIIKSALPLEERTSPDGVENASILHSPKTTLITSKEKTNNKSKLFICSMTNIDDILGTFSTSPVPPKDFPGIIENKNTDGNIQSLQLSPDHRNDNNKNETTKSAEDLGTVKDSSDDESVNGAQEDDIDSSDDDDDDNGSTGTSSSFEVDTSVMFNKCSSSSSSGAILAPIPISSTQEFTGATAVVNTTSCGLIPQSTREKLDDATLQLYKDGDFGTYLDLEASISEQQDEFEGFLDNRKNSIVLRAQLPVRVNAIIEKLLNSDGKELRRSLFSLKSIFQDDKDLVHEFVNCGGLSSLIKLGSEEDQNQNYILRAIGQLLLYVDGMHGVMRHNETIQWLYSLVASKYRLVQKTALKLLIVFVDYVETNCLLLVQAVTTDDILKKGSLPWRNIMSLLKEHDSNDTELLVYAMTLVNKVLNGIPDIDTYYDQVDALEEQGMASLIQKYMSKNCADLDLMQQFQIYEVVLRHEDGEEDNIMELEESMRQKLLNRKCFTDDGHTGNKERRKSRRHSATSTPPTTPTNTHGAFLNSHPMLRRLSSTGETRDDDWSSSASSCSHSSSSPAPNGSVSPIISNGYAKDTCISNDSDVTPGLRRRRERAERQKSLLLEQKQVNGKLNGISSLELNSNGHTTDESMSPVTPSSPVRNPDSITLIPLSRSNTNKKDILSLVSTNGNDNLINMNGNINNNNNNNNNSNNNKSRPWMLPIYNGKTNGTTTPTTNGEKENSVEKDSSGESEKNLVKRENTVKDLTQKLANQSLITSPVDENKSFIRTGELSGVVSKAKEGLAKSKSRVDIKPSQNTELINGTNGGTNGNSTSILEVKKSDNELHWDFLVSNLNRPLEICDLDFTDLHDSDDSDILAPSQRNVGSNGYPPPVPSMNGFAPPPPMGCLMNGPPAPPPGAPPLFGVSLKHPNNNNNTSNSSNNSTETRKTKKTVKLFWKEVREDPVTSMKIQASKVGCVWDELLPIPLDTAKLEHLFESRAKDVITKNKTDMNKAREIVVLDPKRSNAINIGMTKLPPPRTIKAAILKMDATIINREGIEKLLTMLPTEEEKRNIQEAQFANPEIPLGSAEQFLLTLASISELTARLKLWAFKLDYENLEKEVAEPLMDLKQGIEVLEKNKTFKCILTTLLCIGNFLNGGEAKGFQIDYLSKVPEVKDTVHKHSLLHHLCHTVIEKFPDSTDLYSEIGPVTRASRVDFDELGANLAKMETDCKASWDHLRVIAKHDGPTTQKLKMSEFLADCAERIIILSIIHRRVMNRYHKFLLWLGIMAHQVSTTKPQTLFKIISEFALEYRTTRERVIQQVQKKANHRERNKTRGKLITEQIMYKSKEDKADAELQKVLKTTSDTGDSSELRPLWARRPKTQQPNHNNNNTNYKSATLNGTLTDDNDEIIDSLVKTATRSADSRVVPRERKRNSRYSDRKSLRNQNRTLRHGLSEEERKLLAAFMSGTGQPAIF